jgi:flagellar FliL protein
MADEQDLTLDPGTPEAEGGGKKKLIIIIVGVILLIAIAVGVTLFLMSSDDTEEDVEGGGNAEEVAEEVADVSDVPIPAQYIKMKPRFIVNYNVGTRQRFLQVSIEIMTRSQETVDAIELHNPMLRNEIVRVLSDQNFKHLRTPEGRVELRTKLQDQLITVLKRESSVDGVEAVLFTDFVMQ